MEKIFSYNVDKKADIVVFPMLFSANHAIELYPKSINWSLNMLLNMKESFCGGIQKDRL